MLYYAQKAIDALLTRGAKQNVPLSELTTFRIGGMADLVLEPETYDDLKEACALCAAYRIPYYILGNGSNILASDAGFSGLIIRFDRPLHPPVWNGQRVTACAGMRLSHLAKESVQNGFMGLEKLFGIPGTVGGACAMNAGAYGAEIKQTLSRVRVLHNGEDMWVDADTEGMGYRKSPYSFPDCIVLEAEFTLLPDDGNAEQRMRDVAAQRKEKQPLEYPSAGSVFKRPKGSFAGMLIEQCGLKGCSVGGAMVSAKHAGFIINTGNATEKDVTELISIIRRTVLDQTGFDLECEIKRIGDDVCIC